MGRRRMQALLFGLAALVIAAAGLVASAGGATAGEGPATDRAAALDRALKQAVHRAGAAGATAAVVEGGRLVWAGAAGKARSGRRGAMRNSTLFPIASTTKTVTATLAMILGERRALDLDAPVDPLLPRLPGSRQITPRHLMSHSSGLSDYFNDGVVGRTMSRRPFYRWTRAEVLDHVDRVRFRPGSRHSYSNSGYVALGGVLEKASGERVDRLFQRLIAKPLGLRGSSFRYGGAPKSRFAHPLKRRARGGYKDRFGRGGRVPTEYWGEVWTDGGLATTATGLAAIGNGVYASDLLTPASLRQMLPARRSGYGLGTFDKAADGRTWVGHDGAYGGFQSENWTDRSRGVTVVVLTNAAGGGGVSPLLWKAVAAAYG